MLNKKVKFGLQSKRVVVLLKLIKTFFCKTFKSDDINTDKEIRISNIQNNV